MATAVYNRHFDAITLYLGTATVLDITPVPDIVINQTIFNVTGTVTIAAGPQTLTGTAETNWLSWKTANPTHPFLVNAVLI